MSSTNLETLMQSLIATTSSFAPPSDSTTSQLQQRQQENGISLFELKNDLFLSYLHHLSFLILCRVRGVRFSDEEDGGHIDGAEEEATKNSNSRVSRDERRLGAETVKKLAELRVWLEKGVRPCESRLKYQIEKVLKAASDWERDEARKKATAAKGGSLEPDEESGSDGSSDDEDEGDDGSSSGEASGSEITSEEEEEEDNKEDEDEAIEGYEPGLAVTTNYDSDDLSSSINKAKKKKTAGLLGLAATQSDLSYRPNPSMLMKDTAAMATATEALTAAPSAPSSSKDKFYRPPKIVPVAMPSMPSADDPDRRVRRERQQKSFAVEDYVEAELSSAPVALPSIGSTISDFGRKTTTAKERAKAAERREYEEANFVRLPKASKKEMREERRRQGGRSGGWGGEDWRGIEGSLNLDKIERLTQRKKQDGMSGLLERSRKRTAAEGFGEGGGGGSVKIGERYIKKRKTIARRK